MKFIKNIVFKNFINDLEKSNANIKTNDHIIDKLNKTLNNINNNLIFFPWSVIEENNNQKNKINGFYPYNIKLKGPEPTKNVLRTLFYNSTKIETIKQKMPSNKNLIIILLSFNKKELITFNNIIDKYVIFVNKDNPEINWIGTQNYTFKNVLDENEENNIFKCRFSFITSLKGMIEVSRLSVLLYKKLAGKMQSKEYMIINHITKPLSIYLD